ncbi:conserved exported protein of unknown function [Acidithiobacillus ferrivorans]|uniref:Uncharacterized protein n=1 Tax=Acidithiobacillus ferrivorans TaxID=160808 RepID=A0A060UQR4_9PROT|nr:hypothetical protein [Acidithiobacillus ferrivorans]CDQ08899.1 conserved exported hypothetical protein [Acidithiobacillus ferrivorans]SMH66629.1 conserved exported protein of unknown function [Acidithiobacillus ferrivorans]
MIKPLAFAVGPRWLAFVGRVVFACGLACAPVAAWADDGPSLGLVIPGLSVFLGNAPGYYAPPPPVYYAPPPPPPGYYVAARPARVYGPRRWERRGPPPWAGRWRRGDD